MLTLIHKIVWLDAIRITKLLGNFAVCSQDLLFVKERKKKKGRKEETKKRKNMCYANFDFMRVFSILSVMRMLMGM